MLAIQGHARPLHKVCAVSQHPVLSAEPLGTAPTEMTRAALLARVLRENIAAPHLVVTGARNLGTAQQRQMSASTRVCRLLPLVALCATVLPLAAGATCITDDASLGATPARQKP